MKLIKSQATLLQQPEGLEGVYKQIELCGRTCYKSTNKMTEGSAKPFADRMIASKHTTVLEHGTVYLKVPVYESNVDFAYQRYFYNKYSKVYIEKEGYATRDKDCYYITTNLRVIVENNWLDDLQYICEPTEYHEKRYTFRFITDRGIMAELTRHRLFSFCVESTRYCNYSKDKFGNEISYIIPSWSKLRAGSSYDLEIAQVCDKSEGTSLQDQSFLISLCTAEDQYMRLLKEGCTPQQARQVLPNALKTEVCMTGFASDWRYFFDLRYYGKTGKPHPDMQQLTELMKEEAKKVGIWEDIISKPSKF